MITVTFMLRCGHLQCSGRNARLQNQNYNFAFALWPFREIGSIWLSVFLVTSVAFGLVEALHPLI